MKETKKANGEVKTPLDDTAEFVIPWATIALYVVGISFIIFGFIVFGYSFYNPVYKTIAAKITSKPCEIASALEFFVTIAEYYLIAVTFAIVGRSLLHMGRFGRTERMNIDELKRHLFTMIIAISGVTFISILLKPTTKMGVDILWLGLGIAAVAISLAGYIFLTAKARIFPNGEAAIEEVEKRKEEEGGVPPSGGIPSEEKEPKRQISVEELPGPPEEDQV